MDVLAKEKGLALMCGIDSAVPLKAVVDTALFRQVRGLIARL